MEIEMARRTPEDIELQQMPAANHQDPPGDPGQASLPEPVGPEVQVDMEPVVEEVAPRDPLSGRPL